MYLRLFAIVVGCLLMSIATSRVGAEPLVGPVVAVSAEVRDHTAQEARKQHRAGVEAFAAGHYEDAIAAFLTADALHPSPETSFNIAKAYEAQGDESHALSFYREYLRRAPEAADRNGVSTRIAKLSRRIAERGVQQASFIVTPPGSAVLVDSEPIGAAPITLDLSPGQHTVEFRKAGFAPARFDFELPADRPVDVVAKLARRAGGPAPGQNTAIAEAGRAGGEYDVGAAQDVNGPTRVKPTESGLKRPSITRTIGFAALGASVAAIGGAVTLEVMRSHAEDEARRETDQIGYSDALERMKSRQTMARVFAGAGGALAALGGVMLAVASGATERPKEKGLALGCLPGKCHATYSAAF
jgi:hypothetical protein